MPVDIASMVYDYIAYDWGLKGRLTSKKCQLLSQGIVKVRNQYKNPDRVKYTSEVERRAYLAAFAPRYAYLLHELLTQAEASHSKEVLDFLERWRGKKELVICLLGGGPACELFGLVDWLYGHDIKPRTLHVVFVDKEVTWRSFHSYLFSVMMRQHFGKTRAIPYYEDIEIPVFTKKRTSRESVLYSYRHLTKLAEVHLVSMVNCLSEMANHRGVASHLRFLLRHSWNDVIALCADSSAKKVRPRINWVADFFASTALSNSSVFDGELKLDGTQWLKRGPLTGQIFGKNTSPKWETTVKRWAYAYLIRSADNGNIWS